MGVKSFIKKSASFVSAMAMACSMVVMPTGASYAAETNDNLHLSKGIKLQSDGNYKITLEAYATGQDTTTTTEKAVPLDIVLVLDQSGSMADDFTTVSYNKKLTANSNKYSDAYSNRNNLYVLVDGTYYKVTVERKEKWTWNGRVYYYTISYEKDGQKVTIVDYQTDNTLNVDMYSQTTSTTTRLAALKSAVTNFVKTVEQKAQGDPNVTGDEVDHRIAIVGFASESGYGNNTEILSVSGTNSGSVGIKYNDSGYTNATKNAFQDTTTAAGKTMLTNAIGALAANGATNTGLGMKMANDILTNDAKKDEAGRKKLVIMFTDGTPTTQTKFDNSVANTAISNSQTIKSSGTRVYSIGIFDGANPASLESNENKFMNYVSSNYPQVSSMSDKNPTGSNAGYYKAASNAAQLNSIFESISSSETTSGTTVTLNSDSVLRDIISDKFELPKGAEASSVSVYTADSDTVSADGKNINWKNRTKVNNPVTISGNQVDVSGFNYSEEYVTANHPGKKLIVEILVNGLQSGTNMDSNDTEQAKSGIYENSSATTAVKNFVSPKVTIPEYSYVLDYGKKVTIPNTDESQDKAYSETTQMNSTKAAPTTLTSIKKTYGTFAFDSNKQLTYQPGRINWDGFDSIFSFSKKTGDEYEWSKTNVIPANSVYYEDDFGSFTKENPNNDSEVAIVWGGTWDSVTDDLYEGENSKADNNQQSDNKEYGWDSSYSDDNKFSNGSAHVTNDINATATFTFTGTGVDVYSKTDGDVGLIMAQLYKEGSNAAIKTFFIDNISVSGGYYQIPTLSFKDLDYSTYKVVIRAGGKGSGGGTKYYLDGIRVYNPLGVAPTDSVVTNAYNQAGEYNATFKEVRDILLDASNFTSGEIDENGNINDNVIFDKNGAVFIDQIKDEKNGSETTKIGIYKDYGPKNEVYLAAGQSIAFEINSGYENLFIGVKSPTGSSTKMTVTDYIKNDDGTVTDGTREREITHASDMYYKVNAKDSDNKKLVVIENTGTKLLSITKIRATGEGYTMSLTSSPDLMNYVKTFSSLDVYETDESGMVIKPDDTDVDIDNPSNEEDADNTEDNSQKPSNSIWQQIINSMNKWFKR